MLYNTCFHCYTVGGASTQSGQNFPKNTSEEETDIAMTDSSTCNPTRSSDIKTV